MSCQACGTSLLGILDLGLSPICNRFLKSETEREKFYPLQLFYCPGCTLVQLLTVPPNREVFGEDFNYLSGSYPEAVRHFKALAENLILQFHLQRGDLVVDIGSNDGTFLRNFLSRGIKVVGFEPTPKPAEIAAANGVETVNKQFEKAYHELEGKPKLVTALNVLAHTDKIHRFLDGVASLLGRDGYSAFVSRSQYLPDIINGVRFDNIYHEHARYYTATSLDRLLRSHGIQMYDAQRVSLYGGSFLTYASLDWHTPPPRSDRLHRMMKSEEGLGGSMAPYVLFAHQVQQQREWLLNALAELKGAGKRVAGVGAPMSSSTLLNFCKIGRDTLDYLTEVNPLKIGTFSPGVHIPVVDETVFFAKPPDAALILSANVPNIVKKLRLKGYKGKALTSFGYSV